MKKRLTSIAICVALIISLIPAAILAETSPASLEASYKGASQWAVPELDKAAGYGLITDRVKDNMAGNITREEFAEIAVRLYEVYSGKKAEAGSLTFSDTTNPEILKAANLGMVMGIGEGKFGPTLLVTREQMATILLRTLKVINPTADFSATAAVKFEDDRKIAGWAQDGVYYCFKAGIIKGIGNNMYGPQNNSAREVAVIVCTRAYELYKQAGIIQVPGSTQNTNVSTSFSNDVLIQNMENLNSYRRKINTVTTDESGIPWESTKEFAYIKNPLSRHTRLDFPTSGSYNEEIIIGDKLWDKIRFDGEWSAYESYELEIPLALKYDISTQKYPIDYGKLTFVEAGSEKVNGVNCIKYTVSGTYKDEFSYNISPDDKYPIELTAAGTIWIADDTAVKQVIIRQHITINTDITYVLDKVTHYVSKDVIEDDVMDINSTVIQPPM